MAMTPGTHIKQLREDAGLSVRELADIVDVEANAIYDIEKGATKRPQIATKKAIADYFKLRVTEIWPVEEEAIVNG
jgi:DNA-binding XRE family transcriptional regulator